MAVCCPWWPFFVVFFFPSAVPYFICLLGLVCMFVMTPQDSLGTVVMPSSIARPRRIVSVQCMYRLQITDCGLHNYAWRSHGTRPKRDVRGPLVGQWLPI